MEKSNKAEIPIIFPYSKISDKEYINFSEKNRYDKLSRQFVKLRQYIVNDELNEKYYIKEFLTKNGIYEEEYYAIDKLTNFSNFLFAEGLQIDTSKTIREIIINGCEYDPETYFVRIPKKSFKKPFRKLVKNESIEEDIAIKRKNENVKHSIYSFENELVGLNSDYGKKSKVSSIDVMSETFRKKKDLIEQVRKKNRLLEYVVWARSKKEKENIY
jgi:hypothetical protein